LGDTFKSKLPKKRLAEEGGVVRLLNFCSLFFIIARSISLLSVISWSSPVGVSVVTIVVLFLENLPLRNLIFLATLHCSSLCSSCLIIFLFGSVALPWLQRAPRGRFSLVLHGVPLSSNNHGKLVSDFPLNPLRIRHEGKRLSQLV